MKTQTDNKTEIVIMRRSSRMSSGRYKPAYFVVYQNGERKGEFSTRKAAQNLVETLNQ